MKVLFDTNVVLDVLLAREPHANVPAQLFALVDSGKLEGVICATTVTTVHYIATDAVARKKAQKHLRDLMTLFEVAPVDRNILIRAMDLEFPDFEDAVLHEAGRAFGAAAIVTRNGKDFSNASLRIFDPIEVLAAVIATTR